MPSSWQTPAQPEQSIVVFTGPPTQEAEGVWATMPNLDISAEEGECKSTSKTAFVLTDVGGWDEVSGVVFRESADEDVDFFDPAFLQVLQTGPLPACHHGVSRNAKGTLHSKAKGKEHVKVQNKVKAKISSKGTTSTSKAKTDCKDF